MKEESNPVMPPSASGHDEHWHETRDVNPAAMGWLALSFVLMLIFLSITCSLYFQSISIYQWHRRGPLEVQNPQKEATFPPPQLQSDPSSDLARFRKTEDETLNSYRWIDRNTGVVQIPIERAMVLEAERGEPVRQGAPGPTWAEMMQLRAEQATTSPKMPAGQSQPINAEPKPSIGNIPVSPPAEPVTTNPH